MITYIIAALIVALTTWFLVFYYKFVRHIQKFPGPPTNIILGNAWDLRDRTQVLHQFYAYSKKYGGLTVVRVGFEYLLLVSDYDFLEFLLSGTKIMVKSDVYKFLNRWLGTGLLTGAGEKWKKHRKIIAPAFHLQVLEKFMDTFNAKATKLIEKLSVEVDNDSVDIFPYVTLSALDVICESTMGVNLEIQDNPNSEYVYSVKEMCRIILERSTNPLKIYDIFYLFSRDFSKELKALQILHKMTNSVIDTRRAELAKITQEDELVEEEGKKRKAAFLDLLLQCRIDGEPMTHKDIREQVDTFMFAGHDTTAAAMNFALFSLAQYPEIQERVYEEQAKIFADDIRRPVSFRDLPEMKYLENVIKETLRLYPSVPFYGRAVTEDIEYKGRIIPKGTSILIFAYGIHRNEKFYPNPEIFDPSRYDNMTGNLYAYIPFSAGPRNCIGQKFAMIEMKVIISQIVRHYKLLQTVPPHQLQISGETVLKAVNGVKIRLQKR